MTDIHQVLVMEFYIVNGHFYEHNQDMGDDRKV